ncbi:MAG: TldD/PmbA family protein, partial [Armatimonadetes bacterium]|nr:TldD/PmbA family protein [Armatimonadota bacterium]
MPAPKKIPNIACKRALESLGAKPIKSCKTALVFPPFSASAILSYLGMMLSADEVQKGKSLFKDKLGKKVASSLITLIDDGRLKGGLGSGFIDGEGSPTSTTIIVKEGMLQNFLYDTYSAKKMALKSTGNALRSSYHSLP